MARSEVTSGRAYVIDASVAVKWFSVGEKAVSQAVRLQEEHLSGAATLIAPALLFYEVSNALRYNPNFSKETVSEAVSSLFASELTVFRPEQRSLLTAVALALERQLTVYDSVYLAIALELDVPLVTADGKFFKKTSSLAHVELLEDLA